MEQGFVDGGHAGEVVDHVVERADVGALVEGVELLEPELEKALADGGAGREVGEVSNQSAES